LDEAARVAANGAAQSGLSAVEILERRADALPTGVPPPQAVPDGRGGRGGGGPLGATGSPPATPAPSDTPPTDRSRALSVHRVYFGRLRSSFTQ